MFTPITIVALLMSNLPNGPATLPPNALLDVVVQQDGTKVPGPSVSLLVGAGCSSVMQVENQVETEITACRHGREEDPPAFSFSVERKVREGTSLVHQHMKANARLLPGGRVVLGQWPAPRGGGPAQTVVVTWRVPL